ncbi:hypothetical protein GCM10011392_16150 [Wenxinia marina]|nr:hypothetical protein GCM10011392_16150 [Wenxinia marina]
MVDVCRTETRPDSAAPAARAASGRPSGQALPHHLRDDHRRPERLHNGPTTIVGASDRGQTLPSVGKGFGGAERRHAGSAKAIISDLPTPGTPANLIIGNRDAFPVAPDLRPPAGALPPP